MSRRRRNNPLSSDHPVLPFLTIMLGLMSVMALTTMGISVEQRHKAQEEELVELVGIPSGFIPLVMRARRDRLEYLDDDKNWQSVHVMSFVDLRQGALSNTAAIDDLRRLLGFISRKVYANRNLSLDGRQHTIIMWVDDDGIQTHAFASEFIHSLELPIRIGLLPILSHEEVTVRGK